MKKPSRFILFGSGRLLVDVGLYCQRSGWDVLVVSAPRQLQEAEEGVTFENSLKSSGLPYRSATSLDQADWLPIDDRTYGIGLGEVYSFPPTILAKFGGRLFDFMIIRLPHYRGGAHFTWQLLNRAAVGSWSIQTIDDEMVPGERDTGQIVATRDYPIPASARTPQDIIEAARAEGLTLFQEFSAKLEREEPLTSSSIQEGFSLFYPRLNTRENGLIDWSWNTDEIERFICAFDEPYPGASTYLGQKRVFLRSCRSSYSEGGSHPFASGLVIRSNPSYILVACRNGHLIIQKVSDEQGEIPLEQFKPGLRFFTPRDALERAMQFTAHYTSEGLVRAK
jgi:Formyl transferase, C-terminal domain